MGDRMDEARVIAAQCWCDEDTSHLVMDSVLAEAIARRIASWIDLAVKRERNREYYHRLLVQCGEAIGQPAYTRDDGSIAHDVVCSKIPALVRQLVEQVRANPAITVQLETEVAASSGFMGNFTSTLKAANGRRTDLEHGTTIIATGAQEYRGPEYGYGSDPRIVTQQEFEARLTEGTDLPDSVVMVQCVGPAEQFCSRICCTVALKNALALKERKPEAQIVGLYKDIRAYGFKEQLYTTARDKGVIFVRYDDDHRPQVNANGTLDVEAWDPILQRALSLQPDLLVLSMPAVPRDDAQHVGAGTADDLLERPSAHRVGE